jgi:HAD superfamily hydrolase (TIGR01662 family)
VRSFEALLFDLGGTLIYFDGDWPGVFTRSTAALLRHLRGAGFELPEEAFLQELRARLQEYHAERDSEFIEYTTAYLVRMLLAEFGYPQSNDGLIRDALKTMYAVSQAHWHAEADAIPLLATLKAQGYRLGIVSNAADDADVQTLVDRAELRPFFEVILTSARAGIRKPNPKIFAMALDTLGVPAERAAMTGDTLGADILGAANAGIYSIWITRRADNPANRAHAETIHPDATIATLSELPGLFDELSSA